MWNICYPDDSKNGAKEKKYKLDKKNMSLTSGSGNSFRNVKSRMKKE